MAKRKTNLYPWSTTEKNKLINRFEKYGWKYTQYLDFGCSWLTCKNELIRLGYIKED